MTRDEILALDGRELDRAVAERVMGLAIAIATPESPVVILEHWSGNVISDRGTYVKTENRGHDCIGHSPYLPVKPYSSDHNAARLVLAEVERRGKSREMMMALDDMTHKPGVCDWDWAWACLTATPAQICRAALLTVEGV